MLAGAGKGGSESHAGRLSATVAVVGCQGENISQELAQLVLGLPQLYDELLALLRGGGISEAAALYTEFVRFIRSANGRARAGLVGNRPQRPRGKRDAADGETWHALGVRRPALLQELLPSLQFLRREGNQARAAFFQAFGLTEPALSKAADATDGSLPTPAPAQSGTAAPEGEPAIVWDLDDGPAATDDGGGEVAINWDISDVPAAQADDATPLAAAADVAAVEDAGAWQIEIEAAGQGATASTILDDERARALLLSDLLEVRAAAAGAR